MPCRGRQGSDRRNAGRAEVQEVTGAVEFVTFKGREARRWDWAGRICRNRQDAGRQGRHRT